MRGLLGDFFCDTFGISGNTPVQLLPKENHKLQQEIERAWNDPAARIWVDDGKRSVSPLKGGGFLVDRSIAIPAKKPCTHQHTFKGTCLYCWEENVP